MRVVIAHPAVAPVRAAKTRRPWIRRTLASLALVLAGGLVGAFAGGFGHQQPHEVRRAVRRVQAWLDPGALASLPELVLDIKFRHVQALRERRDAWVERVAGPGMASLQKHMAPQVPVVARAGMTTEVAQVTLRAHQVLDAARIDAMNVKVLGARQNHLCTGGGAVALEGRAQDCSAVSVQQLVAAGIAHP